MISSMELKKIGLLQVLLLLMGNGKEISHFFWVFVPWMMREQSSVWKEFKPSIVISTQPLYNLASRISPRTGNFIEHLADYQRAISTQKCFGAIEDLDFTAFSINFH